MPATRYDQLGECNTVKEPIDVFQEGWCRRCVNPECTRSLFGQSRFDIRVNTWEDRLFKNPPRMDSANPLFRIIAGKKFLSVETGPAPEVRSWIDPEVVKPEPVAAPVITKPAVTEPVRPKPEPVVIQPVTAQTVQPVPVTPEPPLVTSEQLPVPNEVFPINTPFSGGRMLAGVRTPQTPPRDPWATPESAQNVVPVGGRVKFKGSGV